jgi:hypothetical protein
VRVYDSSIFKIALVGLIQRLANHEIIDDIEARFESCFYAIDEAVKGIRNKSEQSILVKVVGPHPGPLPIGEGESKIEEFSKISV